MPLSAISHHYVKYKKAVKKSRLFLIGRTDILSVPKCQTGMSNLPDMSIINCRGTARRALTISGTDLLHYVPISDRACNRKIYFTPVVCSSISGRHRIVTCGTVIAIIYGMKFWSPIKTKL